MSNISLDQVKAQAPNLLSLAEPLTSLRKIGAKEWSGPCPFCGGTDRFAVQPDHIEPRWLCRHCTSGKWQDVIEFVMRRDNCNFKTALVTLGGNVNVSHEQIVQMRIEREQRQAAEQAERDRELDQKLAEYTTGEIWAAYTRRMADDQVLWWESQGVPQDWQKYLKLGYTDDKPYRDATSGELAHAPAYTIPYFHQGWKFRNLQYRLVGEGIKNRYRFQADLQTAYYMTTPSKPITDKIVICEGAKKGIVTRVFLVQGDDFTILAVPSKTDFGGIVEAVKDCGLVYIVLDPDAWVRPTNAGNDWMPSPIKLGKQIGKAARVVDLPGKIDDIYLAGLFSGDDMTGFLRDARKVVA